MAISRQSAVAREIQFEIADAPFIVHRAKNLANIGDGIRMRSIEDVPVLEETVLV